MRSTNRMTLQLALGALLFSPTAADAQPTKPKPESAAQAEDPAIVKARASFEEGMRLVDVGDHENARQRFLEALPVLKAPAVLYNLARCEQLMGRPADAALHFRRFMSTRDPKITRAMFERALENYTALMKQVAFIAIDKDKGAKVWIDDTETEVAFGSPAIVGPGRHVIAATNAEGRTVRETRNLSAGGSAWFNFRTTACWKRPPPAETAQTVGTPCDED